MDVNAGDSVLRVEATGYVDDVVMAVPMERKHQREEAYRKTHTALRLSGMKLGHGPDKDGWLGEGQVGDRINTSPITDRVKKVSRFKYLGIQARVAVSVGGRAASSHGGLRTEALEKPWKSPGRALEEPWESPGRALEKPWGQAGALSPRPHPRCLRRRRSAGNARRFRSSTPPWFAAACPGPRTSGCTPAPRC